MYDPSYFGHLGILFFFLSSFLFFLFLESGVNEVCVGVCLCVCVPVPLSQR